MSEPLAWLVKHETEYGVNSWLTDDREGAEEAERQGCTVTSLVAAPSAQTVEEVTQAIDNLIDVVRRSESTSGPYHDWKAADDALAACRAELIALVAGGVSHITRIDLTPEQERRLTADGVEEIPSLGHRAVPPEGAPSYSELVNALLFYANADSYEDTCVGKDEYEGSAILSDCGERARALLSRIPKVENAK